MIRKVVEFLRNPVFIADENKEIGYRFRVYFKLLAFALLCSVILGSLTEGLVSLFNIDLGEHAMDDWDTKYSEIRIVLLAIIIAPLLEEIIFRGPLALFKNKSYFNLIYYFSILSFGAIHLANFEDLGNSYWIAPLLIAPQLSMGVFLGFIRIKFSLLWSMLLHAGYNLVLTSPIIIMKLFNIPIE